VNDSSLTSRGAFAQLCSDSVTDNGPVNIQTPALAEVRPSDPCCQESGCCPNKPRARDFRRHPLRLDGRGFFRQSFHSPNSCSRFDLKSFADDGVEHQLSRCRRLMVVEVDHAGDFTVTPVRTLAESTPCMVLLALGKHRTGRRRRCRFLRQGARRSSLLSGFSVCSDVP
jgi:hypothetical protein